MMLNKDVRIKNNNCYTISTNHLSPKSPHVLHCTLNELLCSVLITDI